MNGVILLVPYGEISLVLPFVLPLTVICDHTGAVSTDRPQLTAAWDLDLPGQVVLLRVHFPNLLASRGTWRGALRSWEAKLGLEARWGGLVYIHVFNWQ